MKPGLDKYERVALERAGQHAGAFLEKLGKTDLVTLTLPEWQEFLLTVMTAYAQAMRDQISFDDPPF